MSSSNVIVTKGGKVIDLDALAASGPLVPTMEEAKRHADAMDKIHGWVCVRERTPKEVRERLIQAGFTADEADEAADAAVRCGLVSEERFASAFIRGKVNSNWGPARIRAALHEHGVSDAVIDECRDLFPNADEEYESAMRVCASKAVHSKDPYATLMRRLVGKGYSSDLAHRVVCDFLGR